MMFDLQKTFEEYLKFTAAVKAGKKTIIIHKDFVVISRDKYEEMINKIKEAE